MKTRKNHNNWCIAIVALLILSLGACGYWYYSLPSRISLQKTVPVPLLPDEKNNTLVSIINTQSSADSISLVWDKHTRQDTVVGKLVAIDWSKGTVDNFPYRLHLTIAVGSAGDQTSYYFNTDEITRITVFKRVRNQEESIPFTELKVGNRIVAIQNIDLLRPLDSNLLEFKITKM